LFVQFCVELMMTVPNFFIQRHVAWHVVSNER
jgi:hypothetical protein